MYHRVVTRTVEHALNQFWDRVTINTHLVIANVALRDPYTHRPSPGLSEYNWDSILFSQQPGMLVGEGQGVRARAEQKTKYHPVRLNSSRFRSVDKRTLILAASLPVIAPQGYSDPYLGSVQS